MILKKTMLACPVSVCYVSIGEEVILLHGIGNSL
jgi:hypothetical protein